MEKQWFILVKDHHHGPLSEEDIRLLLSKNKIDDRMMLWTHGEKNWMNLEDINKKYLFLRKEKTTSASFTHTIEKAVEETFQQNSENVRKNPKKQVHYYLDDKIAHDFKVHKVKKSVKKTSKDSKDIFSKTKNLDQNSIQRPVKQKKQNHSFKKNISRASLEKKHNHSFEKNTSNLKNSEKRLKEISGKISPLVKTMIIFFSLSSLLWTLFIIRGFEKRDPANPPPPGFKDKKLTVSKRSEGIQVDFFLSKKGLLWSTFNKKGSFEFRLFLRSLPGRILSQNNIQVEAYTQMDDHGGIFSHMRFLSGDRIIPGHYHVVLTGQSTGVSARIARFAQNFLPEKWFKMDSFVYRDTVLLSPDSFEQFEKKLARFQLKVLNKVKEPLLDRQQKYQTFYNALSQLKLSYRQVLDSINRGRDIKIFEGKYMMEIGHFLQLLIVEDQKKIDEWEQQNPFMSNEYRVLVNFGRKILATVSDMVFQTKKKKGLTLPIKNRLKKKFGKRLEILQEQSKAQIKQLQMRIDSL